MAGFNTTLAEYRWRGIGFPTTSFKVVMRQDLAPHAFVSRDGADVEATGRAPLEFSARIPFTNNIAPGQGETWTRGTLFPGQWKKMLLAMADRSTGVMQHPAMGAIKCKPSHFEADWDGNTQDGIFADASWLETTDDGNSLTALVASISPIAQATQAARDLDKGLKQITPPLPSTPAYQPTFEDAMRSVQSVFDQVTLMKRRDAGILDNIKYRLTLIRDAMRQSDRTSGGPVHNVLTWPVREAMSRLSGSLDGVRDNLLKKARPIGLYYPADDTSLPMLTIELKAQIGDLMALNPKLLAIAYVPANSAVRYYVT